MKGIDWSGPRGCNWRGCLSKATFHSPSALRTHLKNVHISPLICTQSGCTYKKPFGKQCDFKRHFATIHRSAAEPLIQCVETGCTEQFTRKDKMLKHAREYHELHKCSHNHCTATVCAAERESHLQLSHGSLECVIQSCRTGGRSYFKEFNLRRHLRKVHQISYSGAEAVLEAALDTEGTTNVLFAEWYSSMPDCGSCNNEE
jgi:hypothetical protein